MLRLAAAFALSLLLAIGATAAPSAATSAGGGAPVRQIFLVQNSGWMEPFFTDEAGQFKPLLKSLVAQANLAGVPVTVASFNQDGQVPGQLSPQAIFSGPYDRNAVDAAIDGMGLPRKASGAYADADFAGALRGALTRLAGGREAVIWIVTNNRNSPDNSAEVERNTADFYGQLRRSPHITRIAAFPLRRAVKGPNFSERGFIIWVLAYGPTAARAFDAALADGAPARALFTAPPVRLKPLDRQPVELLLDAESGGVRARAAGGAMRLDGVPTGRPTRLALRGQLRNRYYPQNIDAARLTARWEAADPELAGATVALSPARIGPVAAGGGAAPVALTLTLPAVPRQGALFGLFDEGRVLRGTLVVELSGIDFSLNRGFVDRLEGVSSGGLLRDAQAQALVGRQLPEVFLDYRRVSGATTRVPVEVRVAPPGWPLWLLFGLLALAAAAALWTVLRARRPRGHLVPVGGEQVRVTLAPGETRTVYNASGEAARVTGRLWGAPAVAPLDGGGGGSGGAPRRT